MIDTSSCLNVLITQTLQINGKAVSGAHNQNYKVMRRGRSVVLVTRTGLRVRFNGNSVTVRVINYYKGKVRYDHIRKENWQV